MTSNNPFIQNKEQIRKPTPNEALIFLDFDGVVHPRPKEAIPRSWDMIELYKNKMFFLDDPVRQVLRICESAKAKIVLTTSWRRLEFPLEKYNDIFAGNIIGQTEEKVGNLTEGGLREVEVLDYIQEHCCAQNYAIIDDKTHNFSPNLPEELFLTDPTVGVTSSQADTVISFLTKS